MIIQIQVYRFYWVEINVLIEFHLIEINQRRLKSFTCQSNQFEL